MDQIFYFYILSLTTLDEQIDHYQYLVTKRLHLIHRFRLQMKMLSLLTPGNHGGKDTSLSATSCAHDLEMKLNLEIW